MSRCIINYNDDTESWIDNNGQLHKEDGPAYVCKTLTSWWIHGKRHRLYGPALIEYTENGDLRHQEWWVGGKYIDCLSQEEFERLIKLELFW